MSEQSAPSITRRDVVKGAVALAALGAGSVLEGRDAAAAAAAPARPHHRPSRQRVAIIGAGAGGVAAAYLLGDTHDVDLFEARSKIGGHCDSHVIDYHGQRLTVDLGAQFFHPDTHPIYVTLLEQLGLYDPAHPGSDDTLQAPGSLCIFPTAGGPPVFSSSHPLATPLRAIEFLKYIQLARQAVLSDLPWKTTVDAWIRGLPVSQSFKDEIVVSVDHGVDRVQPGRRAAGVGPVDSADVRVGVSGRHRSGRDAPSTRRSACRATCNACWTAARAARVHLSTPVHALKRDARRLVLGDAGGTARALPRRSC